MLEPPPDPTTVGFLSWATAANLGLDETLASLDVFTNDVLRALKITNGDCIERIGVHISDDPAVPPAVCSRLH